MNDTLAANQLAALGHEARLGVFRLLVRAGPTGASTGRIVELLAIPPSTLAHHLGALVAAGLVSQTRQGRQTISRAETGAMRALLGYVEADCCAGLACPSDDAAA